MNLNNVLARAQQMMLDENFNRDVERAARAAGGGSRRGASDNDFSMEEEALFGVSSGPSTSGYEMNPIPENVRYQQTDMSGVKILQEVAEPKDFSKSKLPKSILESFQKTPSPVDAFDINAIEAQLHYVDPAPTQVQQKPQVREQARPVQQPQYAAPQGGSIDYNYLKYIINECIKENMGKLNEGANMSDFRGMRITNGNVFQFIDTKGNLWEGQLKLKKKAK